MEPRKIGNQCLAEILYSPEDLDFRGSKLEVPLLNRTYLQKKTIQVPCGSVTGRFHSTKINCSMKRKTPGDVLRIENRESL